MILLKEYVEEEWARGEVNGHVGIFPLNYVEVLEDLPPATVQKPAPNKFALPGKSPKQYIHKLYTFNSLFKHFDPDTAERSWLICTNTFLNNFVNNYFYSAFIEKYRGYKNHWINELCKLKKHIHKTHLSHSLLKMSSSKHMHH